MSENDSVQLFMESIVFLQKEKILSMPFARSVMSTCRALFDILSISLSLFLFEDWQFPCIAFMCVLT